MNWGKGIVIGLAAFMSFVIFLVILMFKAPDDSYDKDYYEKGLSYDRQYEQKQNVLNDNAKPDIVLDNTKLVVLFKALQSGKLTLYRPSDNKLDRVFDLKDQQIEIMTKDIAKGDWKLIAEWNHNGKSYLYEQSVFIQ